MCLLLSVLNIISSGKVKAVCKQKTLNIRADSSVHVEMHASVTVEAALSFPIFFFFIWMILRLFLVLMLQIGIMEKVSKTAGELACIGYVQRDTYGENCEKAEYIWTPVLYANLLSGMEGIYDGLRIDFKEEDSVYTVDVAVSVPMLAHFFDEHALSFKQTYIIRGNTGVWDKNAFEQPDEKETAPESKKVYVTENGTVYHRSLACSHLSVKAESVPIGEISEKRNREGKRYSECLYCKNSPHREEVYITSYGTKFHYRADCSALKRSVREVDIEEVKDMRPCSKCGGER